MKKSILVLLFNMILIGLLAQTVAVQPLNWSDGSGGNISSLAELRWLSETTNAWDEDWVLTSDIDASETATWNWNDATQAYDGFSPIGDYTLAGGELGGHRQSIAFTGSFDGCFYTISHLTINRIDENYCGLFGFVIDAYVNNLNVLNDNVKGANFVGAIIGHTWGIGMTYCTVQDSEINAALNYAGGMLGGAIASQSSIIEHVLISKCYVSNTNITAYSAGGFIGTVHSSADYALTIDACWADTHIESEIGGGFVYMAQGLDNVISNCYATGYISCDNASNDNPGGGFVFIQYGAHITGCYASVEMDLSDEMGAFVGTNRQSTTDYSFFDNELCPIDGVGTDNGSLLNDVTGLSTAAFGTQSSFNDWLFDEVWEMGSDTGVDDVVRPRLKHNRYDEHPLVLQKSHDHRGDLTQSGDGSYTMGTIVTIHAVPTKDVYSFEGWYNNGVLLSTDAEYSFSINKGMVVTAVFDVNSSGYSAGDGTAEDPYQIEIYEQLVYLSTQDTDWASHFVLIDDIQCYLSSRLLVRLIRNLKVSLMGGVILYMI